MKSNKHIVNQRKGDDVWNVKWYLLLSFFNFIFIPSWNVKCRWFSTFFNFSYFNLILISIDSFWMDNTYCAGSEKNLTECRFDGWSQNDCHETEAAGVICKSGPVSRLVEPATQPTTTTTTTSPMSLTTTSAVTRGQTEPVAKKLQQDMAPRMRIKVANKNRFLLYSLDKSIVKSRKGRLT